MSGFVLLLVVIVVGLLLARRARRKDERAGLVSERPTFHLEPPTRRFGKLKDERL